MKTAFGKAAAIVTAIMMACTFTISASAYSIDEIPDITAVYDYSYIPDIPVEIDQSVSVPVYAARSFEFDIDTIPEIKTVIVDSAYADIPDIPVEIENSDEKSAMNAAVPVFSGDVDSDGEITSSDALTVLRMANDGVYSFAADADGDGDVTSNDALVLLRVSEGL